MTIIYLLVPLSLIILLIAIAAFFWAVRSGQFEDLDAPGRVILDEETPVKSNKDKYSQ